MPHKVTACHIVTLESYEWGEFLKRFTNQIDCTHCHKEFTEDTEDRRWYPSSEINFGAEPERSDEVHPVKTQHGWFCGEECQDEYLAKIEEAA